MILSLGILIVCLPAQAAHTGQSGLSSPMSDHGAQVTVTSGLSTGTPTESVGKVSDIDNGSSVSSQSPVQVGSGEMISGKAQDRPVTTAKIPQVGQVNTIAGSSSQSGQSGDNSGQSDIIYNGPADVAGRTGSPQGSEGKTDWHSRCKGTIQRI